MCWSVKNKTRSIITASPEIIQKGGTPSEKRTAKNAGKHFDALTNVKKTAEQKIICVKGKLLYRSEQGFDECRGKDYY